MLISYKEDHLCYKSPICDCNRSPGDSAKNQLDWDGDENTVCVTEVANRACTYTTHPLKYEFEPSCMSELVSKYETHPSSQM